MYLRDFETGDIYDFSFWTDDGWCGSGYTTASWGCYEFSKCENKHTSMIFNYVYSKPDKVVFLDLDSDGQPQIENDDSVWGDVVRVYDNSGKFIITVNDNGGDEYYPNGGAWFDASYFRKIRGTDDVRRKVFIFTGPSGIGKSHLTSILIRDDDDDIYDTDEKELSDETIITATYIVIGNKKPVHIDDIVNHIYDKENTDIVIVNMGMFKEA